MSYDHEYQCECGEWLQRTGPGPERPCADCEQAAWEASPDWEPSYHGDHCICMSCAGAEYGEA